MPEQPKQQPDKGELPPKPSQAEGDEETIDKALKQQEQKQK